MSMQRKNMQMWNKRWQAREHEKEMIWRTSLLRRPAKNRIFHCKRLFFPSWCSAIYVEVTGMTKLG
jgi:hypothetical protein